MLEYLLLLAGLLRTLTRTHGDLVAENLLLRQQLAILTRPTRRRSPLRTSDRLFWVPVRLVRGDWCQHLVLVKPETVVRWQRLGCGLFWRWRSRGRTGRPRVSAEVRQLIARMARDNPAWGAERIRVLFGDIGTAVRLGHIGTHPGSATSWPDLGQRPVRRTLRRCRGALSRCREAPREARPMEDEWYADRARLRCAVRDHPGWSGARLARELGRSLNWVKKWRRRLAAAPPDDEAVLRSRSRARTRPPPTVPRLAVERVLAIRDDPPAGLQRVPGPEAIVYFLQHDAELRATGVPPPRSTSTVWRILRAHGRIAQRPPHPHEPVELPPPLTSWQLDFKDVSTVPSEPDAKRQHAVEALNCIDCGTSLLVAADVRPDFTEETTLAAVAELVRAHGLPREVTLDRDPRFVGAPGTGDFPSPLLRFLTCLGVEVHVNPPSRPDLNAFIERYHGTYERECLRVHRPATLEQAREVTAAFRRHYNEERPNQARSCGNRPPRVAFPDPPPRPATPAEVDPDAWLRLVEGRRYPRTVSAAGVIVVEHERYYVGRPLAGQRVAVAVAAGERALVVRHAGAVVKQLPLRGLRDGRLPFERYRELMEQEARARARRRPSLATLRRAA